jgi:hypothetical protein
MQEFVDRWKPLRPHDKELMESERRRMNSGNCPAQFNETLLKLRVLAGLLSRLYKCYRFVQILRRKYVPNYIKQPTKSVFHTHYRTVNPE